MALRLSVASVSHSSIQSAITVCLLAANLARLATLSQSGISSAGPADPTAVYLMSKLAGESLCTLLQVQTYAHGGQDTGLILIQVINCSSSLH